MLDPSFLRASLSAHHNYTRVRGEKGLATLDYIELYTVFLLIQARPSNTFPPSNIRTVKGPFHAHLLINAHAAHAHRSHIATGVKRKSYSLKRKLEVLEYLNDHSVLSSAKEFIYPIYEK